VLHRALPLAALVLVGAACTTGGTSISATRSTLATTTTTAPPRGNLDGVLRIGALVPTTGVGATLGASLLAGLQLAVDEINQAGGVNDQPVDLVFADEAGDPAQASVALERMVEQDLVDAVVGPVSTRVTLSLLGELTSAGIISCSPTNTAASLSDYPDQGYYFRTAPPDSLQAVALGRSIAETGARSAALLFVDDDYGRSIADGLVNELRRQGTEVTARVSIDPTAASYEAVLQEILDQGPEAIAFAGVADPGVRVLAALHHLGVRPDRVPVFVSDGMRTIDLGAALGAAESAAAAGVRGLSMAPSLASASWFRDALAAAGSTAPNLYAAYAYDCANLIALGAQSLGTDDPAQVRSALPSVSKGGVPCQSFPTCVVPLEAGGGRNIDLDGASGPLELSTEGDPEWGTFDQFRFDETGRSTTEGQLPVRST
jgi:branched-chain amino acid transport system substrate-binding protein